MQYLSFHPATRDARCTRHVFQNLMEVNYWSIPSSTHLSRNCSFLLCGACRTHFPLVWHGLNNFGIESVAFEFSNRFLAVWASGAYEYDDRMTVGLRCYILGGCCHFSRSSRLKLDCESPSNLFYLDSVTAESGDNLTAVRNS